ncbi:hypothetical protein N431DRAFT_85440 [Stipitochalara longipes BDJ]|nr:hypothetical protein N431DRAFT_85440 [Stipitochalara longipes BDJ]
MQKVRCRGTVCNVQIDRMSCGVQIFPLFAFSVLEGRNIAWDSCTYSNRNRVLGILASLVSTAGSISNFVHLDLHVGDPGCADRDLSTFCAGNCGPGGLSAARRLRCVKGFEGFGSGPCMFYIVLPHEVVDRMKNRSMNCREIDRKAEYNDSCTYIKPFLRGDREVPTCKKTNADSQDLNTGLPFPSKTSTPLPQGVS